MVKVDPLDQRLFDRLRRLRAAARRGSRLSRFLSRVRLRLLRGAEADLRARRPPVRARIYGRDLLLRADHPLPGILDVCPMFGSPLAITAAVLERPRVRVIDVGANIGDTAALLEEALPGRCTTLCIEPDDDFAEILAANMEAIPGARLERAFVGVPDGLSRATTHHAPGTARPVIASGGADVRALDDVAAAFVGEAGGVDVIKVDTDGFDASVLRSARGLIGASAPAAFFELHPFLWKQAGEDPFAVFDFLGDVGYRSFVFFTSRGEVHVATGSPTRPLLESLIGLALARREIDDLHFDVLAAAPGVCRRVVESSLRLTEQTHRREEEKLGIRE